MSDLKQFAVNLNIPFLTHFTRVENLASIFANGLYPRTRFGELPSVPTINDTLRLDDHLDGISVSIAFPNNRMFYRLRQENPDQDWAILLLAPSILWTKKCGFCAHNAADARIRSTPFDELCTLESLKGMFEGEDRATFLQPFDPTDEQAEVLVMDAIEPNLIGTPIMFSSAAAQMAAAGILDSRSSRSYPKNKGYFAARSYFRLWG